MRLTILVLGVLLVFVTVNYILKCLEYKDLQLVNEAYCRVYSKNKEYYRDIVSEATLRENKSNDELLKCRHKIYVLKKDIKHKDRAIVRYKTQNEVFKHCYHESEKRCEDLRDKLLTETNVSNWYKSWYTVMLNERDAYLYCLRQIQEEVENAKKE